MSKSDTNQTSEDELGEILKQSYKHIAYSSIATLPAELKYYYLKTAQTLDYEKEFNYTKAAIESLIRTEKLKLLAEVRERVIGEDDVFVDLPIVDGTGKTISIVDRSFTTYMVVKNQLRAEQRTKLTKMEAEL